ncbi:MAG TPA: hypothetical protein VL334_14005 [Anaerolineae bacterium]|nr:hypothetical protein [Anaerolineae bacterium]
MAETAIRKDLMQLFVDQGIEDTNFFNGRLLTGKDLSTAQEASRRRDQQLGLAVGAGVVQGLEVRLLSNGSDGKPPVVDVSPGLAFSRTGQAVALAQKAEVRLAKEKPESRKNGTTAFEVCPTPQQGEPVPGKGAYVFAARPGAGYHGHAPRRGFGQAAKVEGCDRDLVVEGAQFRLIEVDTSQLTAASASARGQFDTLAQRTDAPSLSLVRNILAYLCFGVHELAVYPHDPFQPLDDSVSLLGVLRSSGSLDDCDVPLALLHWTKTGVQFLDMWAVRRLVGSQRIFDRLRVASPYGLERLYQFLDQARDLAGQLGGLSAMRVHDYFRFLPPVGFVPVQGIGSPRGFHAQLFLGAFTSGLSAALGAGRAAEYVDTSFSYPAIDLDAQPFLQTYRVRENDQAITGGLSNQRYIFFVSRSLQGPLVADGVAKAMQDAWDVYRGLIKRRVFLPPGTDDAKIAAQIAITSALRDVMDMASRNAALAKASALDTPGALEAFQSLAAVQSDLATLFLSRIPGIIDTQSRETFARQIATYLTATIPGGGPGLLPAISANNLIAAINAQNAINLFVGSWSGEGVAIGPFGFQYEQSPNGTQLVPGSADEFPQIFTVSNGTDKLLTIHLEASIEAPTGDWSNSTALLDTQTGAPIASSALASGTQHSITILVSAPADARVGETATLTLTGTVPPPTNRTTSATLALTVAEEAGAPVVNSVVFDGPAQMPGNAGNAPPNTVLNYRFNLLYTAPEGPLAAPFRFTVNLTSSTAAEWGVGFAGVNPQIPSPGVFTREVTLTTADSVQVEVLVRTPQRGAAIKTASLTFRVDSLDLPTSISAEYAETLTITVNPTP